MGHCLFHADVETVYRNTNPLSSSHVIPSRWTLRDLIHTFCSITALDPFSSLVKLLLGVYGLASFGARTVFHASVPSWSHDDRSRTR